MSSLVLSLPIVIRRLPRARSAGMPMAVRTCDGSREPVVQAELLSEVASVYQNLGLHRRAEGLARQALDLRTAAFGISSLEVSESLIQLGGLEANLGHERQAIETLSRAIDVRAPLVDYPDQRLVDAQRMLGWLARSAQDHDRAAALFREALEGQRLLDPDGPQIADIMFGLAATYHDAGMLDEADSLLRTVLADSVPVERPSPMAVAALRNVGMIRRVREQYADNKVIRPGSNYVGPRDQVWTPIEERR